MAVNKTGKRHDAAKVKGWLAGSLRALAVLACLITLYVAAQPGAAQQAPVRAQDNESLFSRIERLAKEREPDWKLEQRDERKGAENKHFMHGWTLDKEYVSTTTYQMKDSTDASNSLEEFIRSPVSVPVRVTKLEGLGDEAYTIGEGPYGKKGSGTLIVRRVNLLIRLDSSSLETAKRFARHMLDAVDEACGGALCEAMN